MLALPLLDALLLVLVVPGLALRAWQDARVLRAAAPERRPAARRTAWARGIASQWLLVAGVGAVWVVRHRGIAALGLDPTPTWGLAGIALGVAAIAALFRSQREPQRRMLAEQPEMLARVRGRLAGAWELLPATDAEWPGFVSRAVTAGVCEELLFRGFVTFVLGQLLPAAWMVLLLQGVLFGLAHAYQGARGVLVATAVGVFLAGLVVVSGSLWASMLVHSLMDLQAGDLALMVHGIEAERPPA